jgi:hypothetical protein
VEDVGHLGGVEVAGVGGCGLAAGLGCHGASLSCGGRRLRCRARSGPVVRPISLDEQDDYRDQSKHPTIARLGRSGTHLPGATEAGLGPHAVAAQAAPCVGRPAQGRRRGRGAPPPLPPARTAAGRGPSAMLLALALAGLVLAARPILLSFAISLVGSAWRLGALVARGIVAIPRTSRPGCWRVAARGTRGQRRPTPRPRRGHRRAGLGVLCDGWHRPHLLAAGASAASTPTSAEMKSLTASMTSAGCSECGLWPARSMIWRRALAIPAASAT